MKRGILLYLLSWVFVTLFCMWWLWWNLVNADDEQNVVDERCWGECNWWIRLNTCFPIVWDCIHLKSWEGWVDSTTALPYMIGALMKIIMSIIMVVCFILIIVSWIMRASGEATKARELIKKVAITILLLWLSGIILKVINPLFFA